MKFFHRETLGVWGHKLDIFENPTGPPDPRSPKPPQQQKKKFQKTRKPRKSPKVDARSPKVDARSPKVDARSSKVDARSPKVNARYFSEIFEEFKVFGISCWGVTVTGVSKISKAQALVDSVSVRFKDVHFEKCLCKLQPSSFLSKDTPHRRGRSQGSVDPRFAAALPFPKHRIRLFFFGDLLF